MRVLSFDETDSGRRKNIEKGFTVVVAIATVVSGDTKIEVLGTMAEQERYNIRIRQREGIDAAKKNGVHIGRPELVLPDNFNGVVDDWKAGKITAVEAMRRTGLKRTSFYKMVKNAVE